MNVNPEIHGILVQLPLPGHIRIDEVIAAIAIGKDVDGFHPCNVGALVTGHALFHPCTPFGVMKMLAEYDIPLQGQHAVIIGRSNIVGKPMALMLLEKVQRSRFVPHGHEIWPAIPVMLTLSSWLQEKRIC